MIARPLLLTASALLLVACGSDGTSEAGPERVPAVLATTTVWADVARNVGCGGLVDVDTIVPAGSDPHAFEPSLRDRERIEHSDVIVANGLGLEELLGEVIETAEHGGVGVVRAGDHVDVLDARGAQDDHDDPDVDRDGADDHDDDDHDGADDHDHDHGDDGHDHGGADPHIWLDPTRVAAALPAIGDAIVDAGADRADVDACIRTYTDELTALDAEIAGSVEALAPERRLLVTNHHSLGYFADRYGFEVIGTVIPSSSSLASTNPADLEALAAAIEAAQVPAIFAETQHSSDDTEALAARVGDVDVVTLQTDTLGEPGSETDTYVTWLRTTAGQVVDALA